MKNLILALFTTITLISYSQKEYPKSFQVLYATVFEGDTIATMDIPETSVVRYKFETSRDKYLYGRTLKKVETVYPYYEISLKVMDDLETKQQNTKRREFKKFKRKTKKELMSKFEKELKNLTMSEGKILVKMINRKSDSNFNELIKEYFNPIKVWTYNLVAKKYKYDLEAPYNIDAPENKYLEMVFNAKGI